MFGEGHFAPAELRSLPARKQSEHFAAFGKCVYCGRTHDQNGLKLRLTSEHVIPDFLGAGLELPAASCDACQIVTSKYESSIATHMFDAVRRAFALIGKGGQLAKSTFPVDVGQAVSELHMIRDIHHPTILAMPLLYPASAYSGRPFNTDGMFNLQIYNVNASATNLAKYEFDGISTVSIDSVRFCQMIGKIAHVFASAMLGPNAFRPTLLPFLVTDIPFPTRYGNQYDYVGCLWQAKYPATDALHELQMGTLTWMGQELVGVRVRLFASYGMPSYHVAVGSKLPAAAVAGGP